MAWTPPTSFNWGKWSNSSSRSNSFNECNFSWSIKDSCVRPRSSSLLLLDWPAPALTPTNIIKGNQKQFGYREWRRRIHLKIPEELHDGNLSPNSALRERVKYARNARVEIQASRVTRLFRPLCYFSPKLETARCLILPCAYKWVLIMFGYNFLSLKQWW